MEAEIKRLACGKITRRLELGQVIYDIKRAQSRVAVKDPIICPEYKTDISHRRCAVKSLQLLMRSVAINVLSADDEAGPIPLPEHLQGAFPLTAEQFRRIAPLCQARLKLVEKF